MFKVEILHSGILSMIQDRGRFGNRFYGIPTSGAMDTEAYATGNFILGNPNDSASIECHIKACSLLFHDANHICLTGADMQWKVNGSPVRRYQCISINAGDVLTGSFSKDGMRAYIAFRGALDILPFYNSRASYTYAQLGGITGRALQKGDILKVSGATVSFPAQQNDNIPSYTQIKKIGIEKGPEWHLLHSSSQTEILCESFSVSPQSNRMGAYLIGASLRLTRKVNLPSVPVWPGVIQLPPNGKPIVLLQDSQTTGGYPRIGYIPIAELGKFVQLNFQQKFNFILGI